MALSGGHFANLAEVLKATQKTLIPGVVDENVKRGNPVDVLPWAQANHSGEAINWLREGNDAEDDVVELGLGGATVFTEGATFDIEEAKLKTSYLLRKLDKFNSAVHQTVNNYERMVLSGMMRGLTKKVGDKIVYDDPNTNALLMKGLHAQAIDNENNSEAWDIDQGEAALSLESMRIVSDEMRFGYDFWFMPFNLARRIDRAYQEAGVTRMASGTAGALGLISYDADAQGRKVMLFDNHPIIRTDYLLAEDANSVTANPRSKFTSGTRMYSIFAIKLGQSSLAEEDPGLKVIFGKTEVDGKFFNLEHWDKIITHIAQAFRLSAYTELMVGSKYGIGRIFDITDADVLF